MNIIYLDYNATTPLDPEVAEAMRPYLGGMFGNPSSSHQYGVFARAAVEESRRQLASLLNAFPDEIIFTGGGSEANNLAIKGYALSHREKGKHIITTAVEHPAVAEVCSYLAGLGFRISILPVDNYGMIDPDDLRKVICSDTILVSIMHANNEVGTIQPVEEAGRICLEHGIAFHCDAAQSIGKIPVDTKAMNASMLSVAAHKFYGPKGVGALYIKRGLSIESLIHGAGHEQGLRAGTENVMGIAGMGKAAALAETRGGKLTAQGNLPGSPMNATADQHGPPMKATTDFTEGPLNEPASPLSVNRDLLHQGILEYFPDARLNGHPTRRLPNTLSLGFRNRDAGALLNRWRGIAASAGAACHAGSETVSQVIRAMQVPREYALGTIRFSTGRMTTAEEIRMALDIIGDRVKTSGSSNISVGTTDGIRQEARSTSADLEEEGKEPGGITETETSSAVRGSGIRLTAYTRSLGCACKIRPQGLENILASIPKPSDRRIIVGTETRDDAAVFLITEDKAIIQTVDFIPPVADDPYVYGAIAAANALSDVWAMGGKPLFALSVLAFPEKILPPEVLEKILKGASDKVSEAGISIIGGHSIDDEEPKFGLVVSGEAKPGRIWRNATPRAGDALILTKPLGSGIISTAVKKGFASEQDAMGAVQVMMDLNMKAAGVLLDFEVHACTDVTGFGLLGHLVEMLGGGSLDAVLEWEKIPLLEGTRHYALSGMVPGGTLSNLEFVRPSLKPAGSIPHEVLLILADAQTSGGLLVSVSASHVEEIRRRFVSEGLPCFAYIGSILQGSGSIGII